MQIAVAYGLGKPDEYFTTMRAAYQRSRDRLAGRLAADGFDVLPSEATYFLCVDLAASGWSGRDRDFCFRAVREAGVAAIPLSSFYAEPQESRVIRLCFAKRDEALDLAADRLSSFVRGRS